MRESLPECPGVAVQRKDGAQCKKGRWAQGHTVPEGEGPPTVARRRSVAVSGGLGRLGRARGELRRRLINPLGDVGLRFGRDLQEILRALRVLLKVAVGKLRLLLEEVLGVLRLRGGVCRSDAEVQIVAGGLVAVAREALEAAGGQRLETGHGLGELPRVLKERIDFGGRVGHGGCSGEDDCCSAVYRIYFALQ